MHRTSVSYLCAILTHPNGAQLLGHFRLDDGSSNDLPETFFRACQLADPRKINGRPGTP